MTDRPTPERFHFNNPQLDRREADRAGDREVQRLMNLATRPSTPSEENPMTDPTAIDPDAPAPNSMPLDEWMAHENTRQVRREKAEREARVFKEGEEGPEYLLDVARARGAYRY